MMSHFVRHFGEMWYVLAVAFIVGAIIAYAVVWWAVIVWTFNVNALWGALVFVVWLLIHDGGAKAGRS